MKKLCFFNHENMEIFLMMLFVMLSVEYVGGESSDHHFLSKQSEMRMMPGEVGKHLHGETNKAATSS